MLKFSHLKMLLRFKQGILVRDENTTIIGQWPLDLWIRDLCLVTSPDPRVKQDILQLGERTMVYATPLILVFLGVYLLDFWNAYMCNIHVQPHLGLLNMPLAYSSIFMFSHICFQFVWWCFSRISHFLPGFSFRKTGRLFVEKQSCFFFPSIPATTRHDGATGQWEDLGGRYDLAGSRLFRQGRFGGGWRSETWGKFSQM